jgi:hypothetical protein
MNSYNMKTNGTERQVGEIREFISQTLKLRFVLWWSQELVCLLSTLAFYFESNVRTLSVEKKKYTEFLNLIKTLTMKLLICRRGRETQGS